MAMPSLNGKIAILNSRVSNLQNISKAVQYTGGEYFVTDNPNDIAAADKLILPGVGSFGVAMDFLKERRLDQAIIDFAGSGRMVLGICLGMQLLMTESQEFGQHRGLNLIPGNVRKLPVRERLKVPHVGWDLVRMVKSDEALGFERGQERIYYFTHSFAVYPDAIEDILGKSDSGYGEFAAIIRRDNIIACQFHLELSGEDGLQILRQFVGVGR